MQDLTEAYTTHAGSLPDIMAHIPHSTTADEPRFVKAINDAIADGHLDALAAWKKTSTDKKAREARARKAKKEEKEAESAAREMGVWDEFYGDGKASGKGKRGTKRKDAGEEKDVSGLAALIAKRQTSRASAFDALLEKYGGGAEGDDEVVEFSGKRRGKTSKGKRGKEEANGGTGELPVSCYAWRCGCRLTRCRPRKSSSGCRTSYLRSRGTRLPSRSQGSAQSRRGSDVSASSRERGSWSSVCAVCIPVFGVLCLTDTVLLLL